MHDIDLVLLPGLDGSGVLFRPLVASLPPGLRPVVVAYPPDRALGYDELLPLVLSSLPADREFVLLGESFSGPLALMAAAARPAGLTAVVLCATFVKNPLWLRTKHLGRLVRPLPFRLFGPFTFAKALLGGYSSPALRALSREALSAVRPEALACRVRALLSVDVSAELRECPVPVFYIRGTKDFVVPARNLDEVLTANSSVEVARIVAPHLVLQTCPEAAADAIAAFVGRFVSR